MSEFAIELDPTIGDAQQVTEVEVAPSTYEVYDKLSGKLIDISFGEEA